MRMAQTTTDVQQTGREMLRSRWCPVRPAFGWTGSGDLVYYGELTARNDNGGGADRRWAVYWQRVHGDPVQVVVSWDTEFGSMGRDGG